MWPQAQHAVAESFLLLAVGHHLAIAVVAVLLWISRSSMERTVAVYFALAFATATVALASHPSTRVLAAFAAGLSALWCLEIAHPRNVLSFGRTPRLRLAVMGALGIFALLYPGYSGELPSFVFSPLGVTLPPTLLLALAVMNSVATTSRPLHWSLTAVGLVIGVNGLLTEGWIHLPLVAAAVYALPLLLGRAVLREDEGEPGATSVRAVHERMHKRRVLLSRPRRSSIRKLNVRGRRK
ncbi:MAG: hypothetical protein KAW67_03740 [Candidatus Eisenbacteria sp.]|nr:hypothetical protein [Candidatus Eisenbacteria bacterium]